jgi:LuxR family maltose regulon positive regulatory protein
METELLATRLTIPPLVHHVVRRERLIEALEHGLPASRLVSVSAPAGFGKTTLLAQWARGSEHDVAWLTCSASDNDVIRFLRYLLGAWAAVAPDVPRSRLGVLLSSSEPDLDEVLAALAHVAGGTVRQTAIVLDDAHLIDDPDIHRTLAFLLDHMPLALHLVLACREDPPLPLARLRARRELLELRGEDLQLTRDETASLLAESAGPALGDDQVDALHARLEGWAAGAQMVAHALRHGAEAPDRLAISGRHRHIADYLSEEVLGSLAEPTRWFLLTTSILDRLSGPLCDRVTGESGSQSMLAALERANLFLVPLDDSRTWFRYHALFAEFLRDELARHDPDAPATLHRRAAGWYLEHDLPEPAFDHAVAANDVDTVKQILDRYLTVKLFSGERRVAAHWVGAITDVWRAEQPSFLLAEATYHLLTGQLEAGIRRLADAERRAGANLETQGTTIARATAMRCFVACITNDLAGAETYASEALAVLPAGDIDFRANLYHALGDTYRGHGRWQEAREHYLRVLDLAVEQPELPMARILSVHVYGALADLELRQGHMQQAVKFWTRALAFIEDPHPWGYAPLPVTGWVYLRMGELAYERNDLSRAWEHVTRGVERARLGGDTRAIIAGEVILARLELAAGTLEAAESHLEEAHRLLEDAPFPDWTSRFERCHVDLWLARDDLRSALAWVDAALAGGELGQRPDAELARLAIARVLIQTVDPMAHARAGRLLDEMVGTATALGQLGVLIEALALRALGHEARGNHAAALTDIERAVRLAEPEGYVRLFVDLGMRMRWLLEEARRRDVMPGAVTRLLAAFGEPVGTAGNVQPLVEPLSERECQVVRLVAAGLTNREMADALFVSPETVKKHLANIYGKLAVHNRVEVVARARSLGVID